MSRYHHALQRAGGQPALRPTLLFTLAHLVCAALALLLLLWGGLPTSLR